MQALTHGIGGALAMTNLVKAEFDDIAVTFTEDAWFNATEVADKHKRRVADWLENSETQDYLSALAEILKVPKVALLKDRKSTRLNSSHVLRSRMPSSA